MTQRQIPRTVSRRPLTALLTLVSLLPLAAPAVAQEVPFTFCEEFAIQGENAQLQEYVNAVPQAFSSWQSVGSPHTGEINNMGFDPVQRLLFGIELTPNGNNGIVTIDSNGDVFPVGQANLPADQRFDAGDVSADGQTMYVNRAGLSPLYVVDLPSLTTTTVPMSGAAGHVHDWAYNPKDGYLYGGDTVGQLAVLDPVTGARVDFSVSGLPGGSPFGGAWFDPYGLLYLYNNSGATYVLDPSVPAVVDVRPSASATHNDAASCLRSFLFGSSFLDFASWATLKKTCVFPDCGGIEDFCDNVCGSLDCGSFNGNEYCTCTYSVFSSCI